MPVSVLMAGSRMLTADVFALTTRVDRQVTRRTPRARVVMSVVLIRPRSPLSALGELLDQQSLRNDHPLDLGRVDALVGRMDPGARHVFRAPEDELGVRGRIAQRVEQRDGAAAAHL